MLGSEKLSTWDEKKYIYSVSRNLCYFKVEGMTSKIIFEYYQCKGESKHKYETLSHIFIDRNCRQTSLAAKSLQSCPTLVQHHRRQPTRLPCPWDSPGKNTGGGCHFLLQCMKVNSESEVAQSCPTVCDPMDCSLPGSPVHVIFQARVLEWVLSRLQKAKS